MSFLVSYCPKGSDVGRKRFSPCPSGVYILRGKEKVSGIKKVKFIAGQTVINTRRKKSIWGRFRMWFQIFESSVHGWNFKP